MADKNKKIDDLDFSDLDLDEDTGFDEDFTADETPQASKVAGAGQKKKPDIFTMAVYGVVGLCVVGAIVWQLGLLGPKNDKPYMAPTAGSGDIANVEIPGTEAAGENAQPPVANAPSDPFNVMGTPAADEGTTPQAPAAGQPDAAAMEALNPTDTNTPVAQNAETPVTGVMNAADNSPVQNSPAEPAPTQAGDTVPLPAQVPDTAGQEPLPAADTAPENSPLPATTETSPVSIAAAGSPATEAPSTDLKAVMDRLDTIEKRLDEKESTTSPAITQELQDLKQAVAEMKNGQNTSSASNNNDEDAVPAPKKATAKKKSSRKKTSSKKSAAKSTSSEWDKPYNGGSSTGSTPSIGSASGYSLRAAQPDSAWISDGEGSLRQVRVGDNLPGLGDVTSITQSNGQWKVTASGGTISQ